MNLEFLIIGIAKGSEEDLKEYYYQTASGVYALALAYLKDRFLAKEAAIESYRRVIAKAYKFDTEMSAEFWHLDILKNICLNGLCDGEISKKSSMERRENVSILLSKAFFETDEDRGKIIALRCGSSLTKAQVADLLWYQQGSCTAEFPRGIKQAVLLSGQEFSKTKDAINQISSDIKETCPDYLDKVYDESYITAFSNISDTDLLISESDKALPGESQESRQLRVAEKKKQRKKKSFLVFSIVVVALLLIAGTISTILIIKSINEKKETEGTYDIEEPLYRASVSVICYNEKIYYGNYKDGGKLYVYDISSGKSEKISDDVPKDFEKGNGTIVFRNTNNGKLAEINTSTNEVKNLDTKGGLPIYTEGGIIYSSPNGVSILKESGEVQEIFNDSTAKAFRYCMDVTSDGSIIFSAAPTDGLYRLTMQEDGTYYCDTSFSGVVIYDFKIVNDYLIYEDGFGRLYAVNIGEEGKSISQLKGMLHSGAFTSDGEFIYYYGTAGSNTTKGIVKLSLDDLLDEREGSYLLEIESEKASVSDIYVSNDKLLVYLSNGSKDKSYNELDIYSIIDGKAQNKKNIFLNK